MEAQIFIDKHYNFYLKGDYLSGEIIVDSPNRDEVKKISITVVGGLYQENKIYKIDYSTPIYEFIKIEKDITQKYFLKKGKNVIEFKFQLLPKKGFEIEDTFYGSLFQIMYFVFWRVVKSGVKRQINGMIQFNAKNKMLLCTVDSDPVSFFLAPTNLTIDKNVKMAVELRSKSVSRCEGLSGRINIQKCQSKIKQIYAVRYTCETFYDDQGPMKLETESEKFYIAEDDIERKIDIYFEYHINLIRFSSTCSNNIYSLNYYLKFVVLTVDNGRYESTPIPVVLYTKKLIKPKLQ